MNHKEHEEHKEELTKSTTGYACGFCRGDPLELPQARTQANVDEGIMHHREHRKHRERFSKGIQVLQHFMIVVVFVFWCNVSAQSDMDDLVNLEHLKFLTETVTIQNEEMALVHIYSEAPDYEWVDAAGEGLSAVDDVARAALVYLWQYERTGKTELLELAKACLNFVMYMQTDDGSFYNFVTDREGTINTTGNTSFKSLGWWAMRGFWSLGEGIRVFDTLDSEYAGRLEQAYLKTQEALEKTFGNYGEFTSLHGFEIPAWIPGGEPTVASIGVLGLAAYYRARPNEMTAEVMTKIADGLSHYRLGDHQTYPFGMHPLRSNAPGFWHDWGSHVGHALVEAGSVLKRQDWLESAKEEADSFLLRQLAFERFRHIGVIPNKLNQIAYGTNSIVQTYMALYRATGETRYAQMGGLAASWYFGNNMADEQMYFPENGRVFDGIDGPASWRVNRNAGAESTIEGLMSMIAIADVPAAKELIEVRDVKSTPYLILEAETGERVVGTPEYYSGDWTGEGYISSGRYVGLADGQRMRLTFELGLAGDYWLYVAHQRQSASSSQYLIHYTEQPLTIDGKSDDWEDSSILSSKTSGQFLRGAGLWQGAEVDSHHVRLAWDEQILYLFAEVRDPEHKQPFTLRNVWQGDTLWFYLTNNPEAQTLDAKFTLAQTPDGPQVWDWQDNRFLEGAQLAFQKTEGGYYYEAAIPWETLKVQPEAGAQLGFEAGRSIGGDSFMDLTGRDPDVAGNLLLLELAESGQSTSNLTTSDLNLQVRLDEFEDVSLAQTTSPDSNYFWLELLNTEPYELELGEHTLRYRSLSEGENPTLSKVDAFYLQPVVAQKVLEHPDGRRFTLKYDTQRGTSSFEKSP